MSNAHSTPLTHEDALVETSCCRKLWDRMTPSEQNFIDKLSEKLVLGQRITTAEMEQLAAIYQFVTEPDIDKENQNG